MRSVGRAAILVAVLSALYAACAKVPITGRRQFNVIPDALMTDLGRTSYQQTLANKRLVEDGEDVKIVRKVGRRIAAVADEPRFDWSYALIKDKSMNAWCLPGGYIGVYTGILPAMQNEAGMAFVMGHEVGHAVAHHGAERLSEQLVVIGGLVGLMAIVDAKTDMSRENQAIVFGALGIGAEIGVLLPFSRAHESEADVIGMMYAAGAGYPPGEGIKMWDRMSELSKGPELPTWLSTHPSNDARQDNMREWMPRARKRYERNQLDYDTKVTLWER